MKPVDGPLNKATMEMRRIVLECDLKALERLCFHFGSHKWIMALAKRAAVDMDLLEEMLQEIS